MNSVCSRGLKSAHPPQELRYMGARIASRIILTVQVVSWAAFMIGIGLIVSLIAASIYGSLSVTN
jgi:hypothetical protein